MATPGRGKDGKHTRTLDTAERDSQAARLRGQGLGYAEIGAALGYADASGAFRAVARALAAAAGEGADMARRLELERIDDALQRVYKILDRPGPAVDRMGHPLIDQETGEPLPNRDVQLGGIDRLVRLLERRAKVMGTDAPKRSVHMSLQAYIASLPPGELEAEIARWRQRLGEPLTEDQAARLGLPAAGSGNAA